MESAFGVDHGEFSKGIGDTAKKVGRGAKKVAGVREKGYRSASGTRGTTEYVDQSGSWALKPKRTRTTWDNSGVSQQITGGGLTGQGKVAVGAGAVGVGAGAEGYRRKRNQDYFGKRIPGGKLYKAPFPKKQPKSDQQRSM